MTNQHDSQPPPPVGPPDPTDMVWLFFLFNGRIGRELYWLGVGLVWSLFLAFMMGMGSGDFEAAVHGGTFWIAFVVSQWAELALLVKRLHDRDLPGIWALFKFVPFVGLLWMVLAGVMTGDRGANSYGAGPDQRGGAPPPGPAGGA